MSRRNCVCIIFHVACLTAMGMLPVSAFADNPMVIHEVKHDLSRPLRDVAAPAQRVQSVSPQQAPFPQRMTGDHQLQLVQVRKHFTE